MGSHEIHQFSGLDSQSYNLSKVMESPGKVIC